MSRCFKISRDVFFVTGLFAAIPFATQASQVTTFSAGYSAPQDIVGVPAGFGALGGTVMVLDSAANLVGSGMVYDVPSGGGSPTVFSNLGSMLPIGGVFLPSNYGSLAGQLLVTGLNNSGGFVDEAVALNSSGGQTQIALNATSGIFTDTAIAPAGFDSAGGKAVIADENGSLYVLNTDGSLSLLQGGNVGNVPYGLAFAPSGFGSFGGDLLISGAASNTLYALSPTGALSIFTNLPFGPGQTGDRQIAFAPAGFGAYGGDLLVSVSGSTQGGGIAGSVDVVNSSGQVVAYLAQGTVGAPYDPRGIYFPNNQDVLISDTDPSVLSAPATAFTSGSPGSPEPSTWLLLLCGLGILVWKQRRGANGRAL